LGADKAAVRAAGDDAELGLERRRPTPHRIRRRIARDDSVGDHRIDGDGTPRDQPWYRNRGWYGGGGQNQRALRGGTGGQPGAAGGRGRSGGGCGGGWGGGGTGGAPRQGRRPRWFGRGRFGRPAPTANECSCNRHDEQRCRDRRRSRDGRQTSTTCDRLWLRR